MEKPGSRAGGEVGRDSLGLSAPAGSAVAYVTTRVYRAVQRAGVLGRADGSCNGDLEKSHRAGSNGKR